MLATCSSHQSGCGQIGPPNSLRSVPRNLNVNDKPKLPNRPHNDPSPLAAMRPLASGPGPALRSWTKHSFPSARVASAVVTVPQRRPVSEFTPTPSFNSPFRGQESSPTTKIPSFKKYMSKRPETTNRVFQYFMVGSMGLFAAAGAKATIQGERYASKWTAERHPHAHLSIMAAT